MALYEKLINELKAKEYRYAVLDTPSVARKSHEFYERAGFKKISKEELPFKYSYFPEDFRLNRVSGRNSEEEMQKTQ